MAAPRVGRAGAGRGTRTGSPSAWGRILEGAAAAYARKGYAGTSVEDILAAAGVSRRTFYKSFRNKNDVFEALYEFSTALFLQTIRNAAVRGTTAHDRLASCVDAFLQFPTAAGPIYRVFFVEAHEPGSRLAARREAILEDLIDLFEQGSRELGAPGDRLLFRGLLGALETIALHVLTRTRGTPDELAHARAAMMRVLTGALAVPRPPPATAT